MAKRMDFDAVREIGRGLEGVEEGRSYGTPALKVKKKLLARLRQDGDVVLVIGFDNAEMLMQTKPETFYITDHYRGYPAVLVRMSRVRAAELRDAVTMAYRHVTGK